MFEPVLCPNLECGHDIDRHNPDSYYCRDCLEDLPESANYCDFTPSDIARALLTAEPTDDEVEAARGELLWWPVWAGGHDVAVGREDAADMARAALRAARGLSHE